jgi:large subunit ribosomal protein L21
MATVKKTIKKEDKKTKKTEENTPVVSKTGVKSHSTKAPRDNNSFAIIETGGKQYRVKVGDAIKVEKIKSQVKEYKVGDAIVFDKVLLIDNGTDVTDIGTPYLTGAKVSGTLLEIDRHAKVIVIKYKQKSRYFKKNGHRQPYFKVQIEKIG